ncbi:MAG: YpmS family protein [bacterium]|nr:YpmS family protein [bacterium]
MKMKKAFLVLVGILMVVGCALAVYALGDADTQPEPAESNPPVIQDSDPISCDFDCEDGYGFIHTCSDTKLKVCCSYGETACASHGGLEDGTCWKGHLGLNCGPI